MRLRCVMKSSSLSIFSVMSLCSLTLLVSGCSKTKVNDSKIVSQKFVHKYGYSVPEEEWGKNKYPGQVITTLRGGVTVTSTYEGGVRHGPSSQTHPHSHIVQYFYQYDEGTLQRSVTYDPKGMPMREWVRLSPQRNCVTEWYLTGSPLLIEDYAGKELLEGKYFAPNNKLESAITRGEGKRIIRDRQGVLLSFDYYQAGHLVSKEEFYPEGNIASITHFQNGKIHGERKCFEPNGAYKSEEEFIDGQLHGKAIYYLNGYKQTEVFYIKGAKNGKETNFIDGTQVEQEVLWADNHKHGPSVFYVEGSPKFEWYYLGRKVSKKQYDELESMATKTSLPQLSPIQDDIN